MTEVTTPERINIRELSVEATIPEPALPFDVEQEIPAAFWAKVKDHLALGTLVLKSAIARDLRIGFFGKFLEFELNEPKYEDIIPEHPKFHSGNMPGHIVITIANFNAAFPGFINKNFSNVDWLKYSEEITIRPNEENYFDDIWKCINLVPEKAFALGSADDFLIGLLGHFNRVASPIDKAKAAALIRIIFPQDFDKTLIGDSFWREARFSLKNSIASAKNTPSIVKVLEFARDLSIIGAKEIFIREEGFGIIPCTRESEQEKNTIPLPEMRSF